jgi:hypothetical protein
MIQFGVAVIVLPLGLLEMLEAIAAASARIGVSRNLLSQIELGTTCNHFLLQN